MGEVIDGDVERGGGEFLNELNNLGEGGGLSGFFERGRDAVNRFLGQRGVHTLISVAEGRA